ncbi:MAG: hypothetical protein OIF47_08640 [Marinibacterium sp.]|nr:hypothetical protein [Marinibacterium sp.]
MTRDSETYHVDAHVHLHDAFAIDEVLNAAAERFTADGMLMLSEIAGTDRFSALPQTAGDWQIRITDEPQSRMARRGDGTEIAIVAGRQIVSTEGLEVQALGLDPDDAPRFVDGTPITALLNEIPASGALAVLPWGFGKWTGSRGALIDALADAPPPRAGVLMADSGVRLSLTKRPSALVQGETRGWQVLAGTDPLPLSGEAQKVGRFGVVMQGRLDPARPFASFTGHLAATHGSPPPYGQLERPMTFLRQQIAMQLRKHLG